MLSTASHRHGVSSKPARASFQVGGRSRCLGRVCFALKVAIATRARQESGDESISPRRCEESAWRFIRAVGLPSLRHSSRCPSTQGRLRPKVCAQELQARLLQMSQRGDTNRSQRRAHISQSSIEPKMACAMELWFPERILEQHFSALARARVHRRNKIRDFELSVLLSRNKHNKQSMVHYTAAHIA